MARLRIYARRAVFIALDYYDSIVVNYEKRQVIPLRLSRMFVQPTTFLREWKRLGFTDEDLRRMEYQLLQNPKMGDVIQGTGRLRKMRFSYEHRGKSGSVRSATSTLNSTNRSTCLLSSPKMSRIICLPRNAPCSKNKLRGLRKPYKGGSLNEYGFFHAVRRTW